MHFELDARGKRYLERFRKIAFTLPEVVETESFGHPWFRAGGANGKMISVFGTVDGQWSVCFKAGKTEQGIFLEDSRFVKTAYLGHHGWVSLKLDPAKPNWDEVTELLKMSYRNNAPAKLRSKV
ncbi:MAG: MmcQ/YjbR family DNA-binding protein [Bryobacteraceae bacterium]